MAGDGHIRKAQQRRCVMKTVQPYSILPCPTHPSYCLHPLFSLSHVASNHLFILLGLSSWNATWGRSIIRGLISQKCTPLGMVWKSESTLPPWQVTGIREIMRAPYAVIILMNLVKIGFIAQLNQSSHTSKGDIERIRFLLLHAHCNANVTLIPIKSIEMECLLILFHTL